jgi:hypothetical protein
MQPERLLVSKKELKTLLGIPYSPPAHRAPRRGRPVPQAGRAWSLSGCVELQGSLCVDRRAACPTRSSHLG